MCDSDLVRVGDYVVIQRHQYFKLHQLAEKSDLMLGKDKVDISATIGKPFWTMFKMVPKKSGKREFALEICSNCESIPDSVMKEIKSGVDNRNLSDDGKSQLLSTDDIIGFRESGLSAQNIVGKLIENSTTFREKTEFSQEKYLKKKEKKYFEYITVRKPSIRLLANIFYARDQFKIMGLRYDTISQLLCLGNIQHNGKYILYESGTQALVGASILDCLNEDGALINLSFSNQPPKHAILSMNFDLKQKKRFLNVKMFDLFKSLNNESYIDETRNLDTAVSNSVVEISTNKVMDNGDAMEDSRKRKLNEENSLVNKKPKWAEEFEEAVTIVKNKQVDGLVIASKEYPLKLLMKCINFLKPSRQIVIYSIHREPLVELYGEMKKRKDLIAVHIYESWLRNYQILPDRTHPDVTMSSTGGHLLTATTVCCD